MDIKNYCFLFFIYSILGWTMEIINNLIREKKFVNRGFLIGPYCPIYGCGGILITIFLSKYSEYPVALFCIALVLCGVLEYLTSFLMEKIFKARWWDYSKRKFNINGRVCLENIIPFGILSCIIIYIANPFFLNILEHIPENLSKVLLIILEGIFIIDFIISLTIIYGLRTTVKEVNKKINDNTEEITKKVKEILIGKSALYRRLISAFPRISIEKIKQKIKGQRNSGKNVSKKVDNLHN